jgi:hypothetical protein
MSHVVGGPPLEVKGEDFVSEYIGKIPPPVRWILALAISVPPIAASYLELAKRFQDSVQPSPLLMNWLQMAPVVGNLCLIIAFVFLVTKPIATSDHLPHATQTVDSFLGMWKSLWAAGFAYYVFLLVLFSPLVHVDNGKGIDMTPIAASSPTAFIVTNSILNATSVVFSIYLAAMYVFLRRRIGAQRIKHIFIPVFLALLIPQALWIVKYAQEQTPIADYLAGKSVYAPTMPLDLFYNCVFAMALALFVSRFGSRLFGSKVRHVVLLNVYVVMQVVYAVHQDMSYQGKWLFGALAFMAVGFFKILLFGLVQSQLTSGRMLFYIEKMREVDERTEKEWSDFAQTNAIQATK